MKLGYTIIYVADVIATIDFYEKAFGLKRKFVHESQTYAQMETGDTALAFVSENMMTTQGLQFKFNTSLAVPPGFEIAFVTDDVSKAYQMATNAGAISIQEPAQKPWGQTVAYVRDNNGIFVELCSPMH